MYSSIDVTVWFLLLGWLGSGLFGGTLPKRYRGRNCAGRLWRRQFPLSTKQDIRAFLDCFVDGMSFKSADRLKFRPSDRVFEAYRAIYGGRTPCGDDMECERFSANLAKVFARSLDEVNTLFHDEVTLGELFDCVRKPAG